MKFSHLIKSVGISAIWAHDTKTEFSLWQIFQTLVFVPCKQISCDFTVYFMEFANRLSDKTFFRIQYLIETQKF